MAQYLAPGVYVEEIAGPRTIQGVGTSTAAFVGPCRFGPTSGRPELLTSYLDFARIYGDMDDLQIDDSAVPNYLALAVKGFFDEGGSSLYVARIFGYTTANDPQADHAAYVPANLPDPLPDPPPPFTVRKTIRSRFPGVAGQFRVTFTLRVGSSSLVTRPAGSVPPKALTRVRSFDTVYAVGPAAEGVYAVERDQVTGGWNLIDGSAPLALADATAVYPITVVVEVQARSTDAQGVPTFGPAVSIGEFGFDRRSAGGGIGAILAKKPPTRTQALTVPIAIEGIAATDTANAVAKALLGDTILQTSKSDVPVDPSLRQVVVTLEGGSDGKTPIAAVYEGNEADYHDYQDDPLAVPVRGLAGLESIEDVSIVAAPGAASSWKLDPGDDNVYPQSINNSVIGHCEKMRYRVAALDVPPNRLPDGALEFRNLRSSDYASLYYPWITIPSPIDGTRLDVPPSGYMAGIWARSDNNFGVIKAPANEVVRSAIDFEVRLNKAQQELLNPEGVNCLRFFPGPGFLVWGARTISDDPEWKYLSMRRYFNYLEKSIDQGTQWVVFEINGPALWDAVRHTIEGFLLTEWKSGALLGRKPEEGFYVKCDASTMTQDDLDNGRLICIIGVAAAKPAEFVIFRISQWTATATA